MDRGGDRAVEDQQGWEPGDRLVGLAEDLDAEARTAHPHHDDVLEAALGDLLAEGLQLGRVRLDDARDVHPAEGVLDDFLGVGVGLPEGRVLGPEPLDRVVLLERPDRLGHGLGIRLAEDRRLADPPLLEDLGLLLVDRRVELVERLLEQPDAVGQELIRDGVEVDPQAGQRVDQRAGLLHALGQGLLGDPVVLEGVEGRPRHGADGLRADQAGGVEGIGVFGVLGADRRPEEPLDLGPLGEAGGELGAFE